MFTICLACFFPSVVTGTIILVIGVILMRIGINWIFGLPVGPTAPQIVGPDQVAWLNEVKVLADAGTVPELPQGLALAAKADNPLYAAPQNIIISALVLFTIILVMIESTGMFLALSEMCNTRIERPKLCAGLRTDGLGTLIGGLFSTFPYTSFSQNVGLVGVTGVRSRYVCVMGGAIMIVLGLVPKMGVLVEALPVAVLGGAGLVMFGMVAATGVRILGSVDFKINKYNGMIVAISLGMGMIPLVAPDFKMWMPHAIHPLIDSGILLASLTAVGLNVLFNGAGSVDESEADARDAAMTAEGGH